MYSCLLSSVTGMFRPSGLMSYTCSRKPKGCGYESVRERDVSKLPKRRESFTNRRLPLRAHLDDAELRLLHGEGQVEAQVLEGVLQDLAQRLVVVRVDGLHVVVGHRHAQDVLVEGARKVRVQQLCATRHERPDE